MEVHSALVVLDINEGRHNEDPQTESAMSSKIYEIARAQLCYPRPANHKRINRRFALVNSNTMAISDAKDVCRKPDKESTRRRMRATKREIHSDSTPPR